MPRKKKPLPRLDNEDLNSAFGVEGENPNFSEVLDRNLAAQDLRDVLREKRGSGRRAVSVKARLCSYPPPQDELDLHGLTGPEAERKTVDFLKTANTLKLRTIRIITGKGLHSDGPAVLPDVVEAKLQDLKTSDVIFAYQWDKKEKHKSGAVLVYLK